jgi:hypothetical protein
VIQGFVVNATTGMGDDMNTFDLHRTQAYSSQPVDFETEPFQDEAAKPHDKLEERNTQRGFLLQRLAEQLERRPIEEIAALIRNLTYGEMIEFAEGLWNFHPGGSGISKESLASLLYHWSTSQRCEGN